MITYRAPIRLKYHDPVHNHLTHFVVRLQHCCKGWPDDNRKYVSLPPLSPHTTDSPWVPAELRLPKDNDALLSGAVRMDVFAQLDLAQWDPENIRTSTVVEVRVGLHHDAVVKGDASGKLVLEAKDHDPIVGHHYVSWEWDLSGTAGLLERLCSLESKRVQQQASKLQHVWTTLARQTELDYSAYESNPYYSNWFVTTAIGDVPGWSVMFHLAVEAGCPIPRSLGDGRFPGCIVPDILDRCLEISAKLMDLSWEDLDTLHPAPLVLEWIKNAATLMSSPIPFMEGKVWERGNARPTLTSASRWIFGNPHFRSVADCEDHSTAAALFLLALQFCTWEEDATDPGAPPPYVPKFLSAPKFKWGRRAQRILRQYTVAVAVAKFDAGGDDVKSASSHQFTLLLPTRWLIEDLDNKNNLRASAQTQPVCLVEGTFSSPATARFVKYPGKQLALKNPVSREPMWWGDFCTAVRRSPFDEQLRCETSFIADANVHALYQEIDSMCIPVGPSTQWECGALQIKPRGVSLNNLMRRTGFKFGRVGKPSKDVLHAALCISRFFPRDRIDGASKEPLKLYTSSKVGRTMMRVTVCAREWNHQAFVRYIQALNRGFSISDVKRVQVNANIEIPYFEVQQSRSLA